MNFTGIFTVWEIEDKGTWAKVKMSDSFKDKDGHYVNCNYFGVMFFKEAAELVKSLNQKDKIKVTNGVYSPVYDKDKKTTYHNYKVFHAELPDGQKKSIPNGYENDFNAPGADDVDMSDVPF